MQIVDMYREHTDGSYGTEHDPQEIADAVHVLRTLLVGYTAAKDSASWRSHAACLPRASRRTMWWRLRGTSARPLAPTRPNQVWADAVRSDRCANGQHLKRFTVVDEWTRAGLTIEVEGHSTAKRVVLVLPARMEQHGRPTVLRRDNGPEFVARAGKAWLARSAVHTADIDIGKPW
jgi:hypothetical protein